MSKLKSFITRSEVDCPIFGAPSELNATKLRTISDIIKYILHVRHDLQFQNSGKQPATTEVFAIVSRDVESIWVSASIPIVSSKRIKELLKKYYDEYLKLIRYPQSKRSDSYLEKVKTFKNITTTKIFDIAACKCLNFISCVCPKSKKVPVIEQKFLFDQRSERKMIIAGLDKKETEFFLSKIERQQKCQERCRIYKDSQAGPSKIPSEKKNETASPLNVPQPEPIPSTSYNTLKIPKLARVCDRYGVSNRSAAAITTAVLQDLGLVSSEEKSLVVDKSKLRRARNKARYDLQTKVADVVVESIYFDGRKDKTLLIEKINGRSHRRVVVKEHISLVSEPGSLYLGHTTPRTGTGKAISDSIVNYCKTNNIDLKNIKCIGCDGTATNTGWKSGVIRFTELKLGRPLQWCICQLHANELPLRHLFNDLDGSTSGPREYSGPIGKALENCESLPIQKYLAVTGDIIDLQQDVVVSLSTDQKYLYEMCHAVSSGVCSAELANRQPGKMAHSRWLTTANRILRLYVGCREPSENLKVLVEYIIKVYAPIWFLIKREPACHRGPQHVFKLIQFSRCFDQKVREIIDPVIQRNAFFAHPENLLLAMISDERRFVRELGLRRIVEARNKATRSIRVFKLPKLNFSATDYIDVIVWAEYQITPPPLLSHLTDKDLNDMVQKLKPVDITFSSFPCHTQAVERCVKLVTEASVTVVGEKARDGIIRSKLQSRSIMPTFDCKAQYKC